MQFELEKNHISPVMAGLSILCVFACGAIIVAQNQHRNATDKAVHSASEASRTERAIALTQVAKEHRIRNCWIQQGTFTVDRVVPPLEAGSIPSTCLASKDGSQFAYIAEYDGAMRMKFVFTQTELINQLSRN